MSSLVL